MSSRQEAAHASPQGAEQHLGRHGVFLERLPVVCLHGWGMRGSVFSGVAQPGWQRPDLPGYGDTALPADNRATALADRMAAEAPERLILLGWSMGGLIAQAWAARHPEQVAALVLVAATPCFQQRADWPQGLPANEVARFSEGVKSDWRGTLNRFLSLQARGSDDARTLIAQLRAEVADAGDPCPETLAAGMRLLAETDLRDQAAHITQPTLLIHGARDGLCAVSGAAWLAEEIPNARLAVLERAAHAPFLSHPGEFSALLREFIHG